MRFMIISASHRTPSNSARVAALVQDLLRKREPAAEVDALELASVELPFWNEDAWDAGSELTRSWLPYQARLRAATGLVLVVPEWHGMVPPKLKNFLLFAGTHDVGHKPVLVVTVSAGIGGMYPLAELRLTAFKNNRLCILPEHVIVRNAAALFEPEPSEFARETRGRLSYGVDVLRAYERALGAVRGDPAVAAGLQSYGM